MTLNNTRSRLQHDNKFENRLRIQLDEQLRGPNANELWIQLFFQLYRPINEQLFNQLDACSYHIRYAK